MEKHKSDMVTHEEIKKLFFVVVFLLMFVIALFGLAPFA